MRLLSRIGRRGRAALLLAAGAAAGGGAYVAAAVPDSSTGVIHSCVRLSDPGAPPNQTPGNFYLIDPSAGQSCPPPSASVAPLDWNFKGPVGAQGAQGPAGKTFTVAAPTVKPTFTPVGQARLGTGLNALKFNLLTSGFDRQVSSSGRTKVKEINVTKKHDTASSKLLQFAATGHHIPQVVVTMRKAGGTPIEYLKITMKDVIVTAVKSESASDEGPTEEVTFTYGKLVVVYQPQNP